MTDATRLLNAVDKGDPGAPGQLLDLVYDELRRLASHKMAQEAPGQTLQPTALVHEAWLRLVGADNLRFENRGHFFSAAAEAMRRILIDRARAKLAAKRGARCEHIELEECNLAVPESDEELLAVHDALDKLAAELPVQAEVVKLRYFGGLTNEEIAQALDISISTVKNYWVFARAWLFDEIKRSRLC